jgi:hypothetical protein
MIVHNYKIEEEEKEKKNDSLKGSSFGTLLLGMNDE